MVSDSSLTVIGTPGKHNGSFKIELIGSASPEETEPPLVLQYIVRSLGNKGRGDPVIVQNTWTATDEWGRENLEPWLISNVRISGDIKLLSVIGSGLPTSEIGSITDLEMIKAPHIALQTSVDLFIGVFSTANNFRRRMAVRRTWMQYEDVRTGRVVVRFFVGLHNNGLVNQELWREAETYGDIQILPFVDYYDLITWKSIAICIYGTDAISARYVMKTDDDAFVRVDSILSSLKEMNITNGLLYGHLNNDTSPHRDTESKWYITEEEWEEEKYPPWANGPGYVVSHDIAKLVHKQHKIGALKMFKLEDVAMGIWVNDMKNNEGVDVQSPETCIAYGKNS
ncbi:hypothetical protein LUZ62_047523 [Rhynchospora pubera]|uniref:Hexosyltransferase n=1 Tax=Rhynchospora pubera TaxID=906938 RepID=A0AAV8C5U3_9POAL|nr:hypothetical protein LUZ62_085188 [Rhynchospora pubera]KAJ4796277.1 hypothetical protein LUZ62_047523 [Rhynchospora pubera]